MSKEIKKVEVSYKTIAFTVLFLLALWFLYQIRQILLGLFIAIILMGALNPIITRVEKSRVPRWLAIVIIYIIMLVALSGAIAGIVPPLVDQTSRLVQVVIDSSDKLEFLGFSADTLQTQFQELGGLPTQIVKLAVSVFSNVISIFAILMIAFYLLLEHQKLDDHLFFLFGDGKQRAERVIGKIEKKLGGWVRAQLLLMTIVGTLSYIGFRLLGLKFSLPLAILAGLLEVIPNIGPTLAAVPAIIFGLLESPLMGLMTFIWTIIVQQLENNLIVPKLMQKSVGANPLITILSLTIGFKIAGVMGAILAMPIYLMVEIIVSEYSLIKKAKDE